MKNLIFEMIAVILMLTGCGNDYEIILRGKILPDFENVISVIDHNHALYAETVSAAEKYIENPSEETKAAFLETEEKNSQEILNNSTVTSALDGSEDDAMNEYGISKEDYNALFSLCEVFAQEFADWSGMKQFIETDDVDSAEATLTVYCAEYVFAQKNYCYGIMDMFSDAGDENIEYVKSIVNKYPNAVYDCEEWLTDHDEIEAKLNEAEAECTAVTDEYEKFINQLENNLLDMKININKVYA